MLFIDKLHYYREVIMKEMDELLETAWSKQPHPGDLLVLYANGAYRTDLAGSGSPFMIGPAKPAGLN